MSIKMIARINALVFFYTFSTMALGHDKIYKGIYIWGSEVNTFSSCESENTFWTSYNSGGLPLVEFHKKNTTKPYQGIYVEFRGHLLNEELDGFASQYDGLIHISEIKKMSIEIPKNCEKNS